MSKAYEDFTDEEKITRSMHLEQKVGPALTEVLKTLEHQFDQLVLQAADLIRDSIHVGSAYGPDLDEMAAMFDIRRRGNENDGELRTRIELFSQTYETLTVDAIQDLFEGITGRRPYIYEGFRTRVYRSGDSTEEGDVGRFQMIFEIPRNIVHERLKVQPSGTYVILGHSTDSMVTAQTTAVSQTTSVGVADTTIYVQSVSGFPDFGEINIDTEWIRYHSRNTTADSFENCDRGMWDSEPETHSTNAPVEEGTMLAWIEGSNNMVFDYRVGRNVYLTGGPYEEWTWVDLQYKIGDLDTDYDTLAELAGSIGEFRTIGMEYKAAGIRADFNIGHVMQEWWEQTEETLVIQESILLEYGDIEGGWSETLLMPVFAGVFQVGYWDKNQWGSALWSNPSGLEESGAYNLRIEAWISPQMIQKKSDAKIV